jgi:hypothetical protein
MRSADDLLRDILRTAHVTGLSREHQEAIGEALAAQVYEAGERASVRGMSLAPLPEATSLVTEARDRLLVLHARPPEDPRAVAAEIEACAALLSRAIGGPIDPNAPSGG